MMDTTDWQLIRRYVKEDAQAAFALLVRRHLDLVYCTCLRELGEPSLAEDATQAVFLILARKARSFRPGTTLSSWLFQTALLTCKNVARWERRRVAREERLVMEMEHAATPTSPSLWSDLEPLLNEALRVLPDAQRGLVLERFLEDRPLAEIGAARGISEDAARMRLNRALERLRRFFAARNVLLSAAALAALLPQAVHPAPAHCAESLLRLGLTPAVPLASVTPAHTIAQGAIHTMNLHRLRLQFGAAALVAACVLGPAGVVRVSSEHRAHVVRAEQPSVAPAQSVSAGPQQGDPQALAVLSRMYPAYTAMQSFRCHDVIWEDNSGANSDTEYEIERPGRVRFDRVTLFDPGKVSWLGAVDMSGQALAVSDGRDLYVTFTPNHKQVKPYAEIPLSDPESNSYNFADWGGLPSSGGVGRAC